MVYLKLSIACTILIILFSCSKKEPEVKNINKINYEIKNEARPFWLDTRENIINNILKNEIDIETQLFLIFADYGIDVGITI